MNRQEIKLPKCKGTCCKRPKKIEQSLLSGGQIHYFSHGDIIFYTIEELYEMNRGNNGRNGTNDTRLPELGE